jgi:hypothetical protein
VGEDIGTMQQIIGAILQPEGEEFLRKVRLELCDYLDACDFLYGALEEQRNHGISIEDAFDKWTDAELKLIAAANGTPDGAAICARRGYHDFEKEDGLFRCQTCRRYAKATS